MIFDSHAHYDDEAFDEDRDILLSSFSDNGINKVMNVGASIHSTKTTIALSKKYDFIYGAAGVHPSETGELNEENFLWLREQMKENKVKAVGEIGLDYHWPEPEREIQKTWFIRQLLLAKECDKPVIIHSRDAAEDTLQIMKAYGSDLEGVIHCFSYSREMAEIYTQMGYYIGIGGVVTFKNAKKTKEVVEAIPLSRIVLETDSPYLTPEPNRGKRNCSLYLKQVALMIAKIKQVSEEEVEEITYKNACSLYQIKE